MWADPRETPTGGAGLNVAVREDPDQLRSGHGAATMAVIKHSALNLLNQAKPALNLKNRRRRAAWNTNASPMSWRVRFEALRQFPWCRHGSDCGPRPGLLHGRSPPVGA